MDCAVDWPGLVTTLKSISNNFLSISFNFQCGKLATSLKLTPKKHIKGQIPSKFLMDLNTEHKLTDH